MTLFICDILRNISKISEILVNFIAAQPALIPLSFTKECDSFTVVSFSKERTSLDVVNLSFIGVRGDEGRPLRETPKDVFCLPGDSFERASGPAPGRGPTGDRVACGVPPRALAAQPLRPRLNDWKGCAGRWGRGRPPVSGADGQHVSTSV